MASTQGGLVRGIGRWDLVGILINGVVGAGIFGLPARLFALVGVYSLAAWIVCALLVGMMALCFAEISSRFDETGGSYLYVLTAFGPRTGFLIGWIGWMSRLLAYASICNLAVDYGALFYPPLSGRMPHKLATTAITIILTMVVVSGVRYAAVANNGFTVVKLTVLFGLAVVGLAHIDPSRFTVVSLPAIRQFQSTILLMLFAFMGFESATVNGGEMRNPRRDPAFALGLGLAAVTVLYVLIQAVCIGAAPDLAGSDRPIADAAIQVLGPIGGEIATMGAVVTMLGTLMVLLIAGPRIPFAMAEHEQLPRLFRSIHPRFRTPHFAILIHGAAALMLTLSSSVIGALSVSTVTRLVTYAATCAALIAFRRSDDARIAARFKAPGGAAVAVAAIVASLWLMLGVRHNEMVAFAVIVAVGAALGGAYAIGRRRQPNTIVDPIAAADEIAGI